MKKIERRKTLRRGVYILPSLFTMGNIVLGFYGLVLGYRNIFFWAAVALIGAAILDALDGRVARLTHTESEFGKEFDSLADVLTFGAVPAILAFLWGLHAHGRIGWLIPLFFLLCTAVRLARFNVQARIVDSRNFVGLPSPAAAGTIASVLFLDDQLRTIEPWLDIRTAVMAGALIGAGILMVSTFRYPSFKKIDLRQRRSYRMAALNAAVLLALIAAPIIAFQAITILFTLSGPALWLWGRLSRRTPEPARDGAARETAPEKEPVPESPVPES